MGKTVGIDFSTTNSVVVVMDFGRPMVIIDAERSRVTPSVVAFKHSGERLVGQAVSRQGALNPQWTIFSTKRFIGRRYPEVEEERKLVPYRDVYKSLPERFAKFGLELAMEKTKILEFGRFAERNCKARGEGKPETFNFLGFTFYCSEDSRKQFFRVKVKTERNG